MINKLVLCILHAKYIKNRHVMAFFGLLLILSSFSIPAFAGADESASQPIKITGTVICLWPVCML